MNRKPKSEAEKALDTIQVSKKHLPKSEPERTWTLRGRQRRRRDSLIAIALLKADNFDSEVALQAEKFGLQPGRILAVWEKSKVEGRILPEMAAQAEVFRHVKAEEILHDYDSLREELDRQIEDLEARQRNNETTVEVEVIDTTGKHEGTKTKMLPINTLLVELKERRAKSHDPESAALDRYRLKQREDTGKHPLQVVDEFINEFQRIEKLVRADNAIDTQAEVIQ